MVLNEELISQLQLLASISEDATSLFDTFDVPDDLRNKFDKLSNDALVLKGKDVPAEVGECRNYRFSHLLVKHFRKYSEYGSGDSYAGLNTKDVDMLFLLGDNGSGKSSMFDAAEYLFTSEIGEAAYRNIDKSAFASREDRQPDIIAEGEKWEYGISGNTDNISEIMTLPLPNFFISENSIYRAGKMIDGENFYPYICELLGIGSLWRIAVSKDVDDLVEVLIKRESENTIDENTLKLLRNKTSEYFKRKKKSSNEEVKSLVVDLGQFLDEAKKAEVDSNYDYAVDLFKRIKNRVAPYVKNIYLKHWQQFQDEVDRTSAHTPSISTTIKDIVIQQFKAVETGAAMGRNVRKTNQDMIHGIIISLQSDLDTIHRSSSTNELIQEIKKISQKYAGSSTKTYSDTQKKSAQQFVDAIHNIQTGILAGIEELVNEYIDDDFKNMITCLFTDYHFSDNEVPEISVITNNRVGFTVNGVSVVKYFNTFRFRMFFIILQTAVCLRLMQKNKVLFPIMIDDIFYANDFHNKMQLSGFFDVVKKYCERNFTKENMPQIIFFSHDEQLVTSISQMSNLKGDNICYGRIIKTDNIDKLTSTRCEDAHGRQYYNIYIKIFNNKI